MTSYQFFINSYLRLADMSEDYYEKQHYMYIANKFLEKYAQESDGGEIISEKEEFNIQIIDIVKKYAVKGKTINISYDQIKEENGNDVFGEMQPKRLLDSVAYRLRQDGVVIKTGKTVKYQGRTRNGFSIYSYAEDV